MYQIFAKIIDACFDDNTFLNKNNSNGVFGGIE